MALNAKFWKFQKKLTCQSTLAWLKIVIIYPAKNHKTKLSKNQNHCNDIRNILLNKNKLQNFKPKSVNLPGETSVSINGSFRLISRNCGPIVKKFRGTGHISAFWVSKGLQRIKLSNESMSIVAHDCGLKRLFPVNPLNEDNQLLIPFNIFYYVNKFSSLLVSLDVSFKAGRFPPV